MCTALAPRIGYDAAAAVAKKAFASGRNVREVALELAGKSHEHAAATLGVPLKGEVPTAEDIDRMLHPHGQTIRGTGVGGAAGG